MLYTEIIAICSEKTYKTDKCTLWAERRTIECKTWWHTKETRGFKKLRKGTEF
jgi:hypothetical protein